MDKFDVMAGILVAALCTAIIVVPNLIAIWLYVTLGFSWAVVGTVSAMIFLVILNYAFRISENES